MCCLELLMLFSFTLTASRLLLSFIAYPSHMIERSASLHSTRSIAQHAKHAKHGSHDVDYLLCLDAHQRFSIVASAR